MGLIQQNLIFGSKQQQLQIADAFSLQLVIEKI
jgi:hypothetical protein